MILHPIHYALTMGVISILGGTAISMTTGQPWAFLAGAVIAYIGGGQFIGRFGDIDEHADAVGSAADEEEGYSGTKAGFIQPK